MVVAGYPAALIVSRSASMRTSPACTFAPSETFLVNPFPSSFTVSTPTWMSSSPPARVVIHTAWPVSKILITSPSHGAMILPSEGSTATVVPSISDANVSSLTSESGTTFPLTGLPRISLPISSFVSADAVFSVPSCAVEAGISA